ncbi:MAG TPA: AarF/ABC1/UbiB kinase family protein [Sphingobium sp.]|nr:AarF/ABC1/UbiB kinase family protein [Sphingobium sp.]
MIKTLAVAARDRARLAEITGVATRYGLGLLLARLGLGPSAPDGEEDAAALARRTRLAFEALGPVFVKLGQILATRGDLLSGEWIAEFERLHSQAPTLPFDELRAAVEDALGEPPETAFATFETAPLAAASMAQVHRATLADGRDVVLKIRRPGIRPRVEADLRLLGELARTIESASAQARRFGPQALLRQLAEAMLAELDFTHEGRNADRLRADFAGETRVVIPQIHWRWTSETLIVMDYVAGVPPRDPQTLRAAGLDPAAIASVGADLVLDMVLINGRFHADPHPGNLLCLPGNRIALLDFGMIGHVSPRRREEFLGFIQSLLAGDPDALAGLLAVWSGGDVAAEATRRAAERLIAKHGGGRLVLSALIADFFPIMREERLILPPDLLLIFKAMVTIDGVLGAIEPGFDLSGAMRRAWPRLLQARLAPGHWIDTGQALLMELSRIGENLPRLLRAVTRKLDAAPRPPVADGALAGAVRQAGLWIAAAILLAGAMITAGMIWG